MQSISPICSEWLRALIMPVVGVSMLYLGRRISGLPDRLKNGLSLVVIALALISVAAYYRPLWFILRPTVEWAGGPAVVTGCALLLLVGVAGAAKRSGVLNIVVCTVFVIIQGTACVPLYWHYLAREAYANYPDKDGLIHQTTGVTCVPASASMLLNRYGFRMSEGFIAERSGTDLTGTDDFTLAQTLNRMIAVRGLRANIGNLSYEQAAGLHRPLIVAIILPVIGPHSVMVNSIGSHGVNISDPMSGGQEDLSVSEFKNAWAGKAVWISGVK